MALLGPGVTHVVMAKAMIARYSIMKIDRHGFEFESKEKRPKEREFFRPLNVFQRRVFILRQIKSSHLL